MIVLKPAVQHSFTGEELAMLDDDSTMQSLSDVHAYYTS